MFACLCVSVLFLFMYVCVCLPPPARVAGEQGAPGLVGGGPTMCNLRLICTRWSLQDLMWATHIGPGLGRHAPRRWPIAAPWKGPQPPEVTLPVALLAAGGRFRI